MFDPFDFDQTERKIDLDKMEVYRIDTPELSEDEIVEIMNRIDERTRQNDKRTLDTYSGPSPMDLPSYRAYWQTNLYFLIGTENIERICEDVFADELLYEEYGITFEELFKPSYEVYEKVKKHLASGDKPKTRRF